MTNKHMKVVNKIVLFLRPFRIFLMGAFFFGVLIDLFNAAENSDIRLFPLLFLWIITTKVFRFKSDMTLKLALGFLGLLFLIFVFSRGSIAGERVAVWIYFFLWIGIGQQFIELAFNNKAKSA